MSLSLQETYAPKSICFGCGPANQQGLRIRSFVQGDQLVCSFSPLPHHAAFPGVLNGGIIGALLDCHCNWAACWTLMQRQQLDAPPCTVTADYSIVLKRPCPTDVLVSLVARTWEVSGDRCVVEGELIAAEKVRANCRGTFVAVGPTHPGYHRW